MKFPVLIDYEEGIVSAGEPSFVNAGVYLLWIRDTYIQDTPFTYRDIEEIHKELKRLRPIRYRYQWESLRDLLRNWIARGVLIVVLDGYDLQPGNHMLMWASYYRKKLLTNKYL